MEEHSPPDSTTYCGKIGELALEGGLVPQRHQLSIIFVRSVNRGKVFFVKIRHGLVQGVEETIMVQMCGVTCSNVRFY